MGAADGGSEALGLRDAVRGPLITLGKTHSASSAVRISSGVAVGMLMAPIRPAYPNIARIARVEGTVVVAAIITRTGTVDTLRVVSGPVMLQQAALDAIRTARYRPFFLNGSPTEVQTTISINFRLGN